MNLAKDGEATEAEKQYLGWSQMLDHALLRPESTDEELRQGIELARAYQVASVCILPHAVQLARTLLLTSETKPSTTIGFPHGGQALRTKEAEAVFALEDGAEELDMVVNISRVRSGDWTYVRDDILAVLIPTRKHQKRLKVIFENAYLDEAQKLKLCAICDEIRVDWVKTSTGFAPSGATPEDVALLRAHVGDHVQVKAAGGIRTFADLAVMRQLGASRCGSSQTARILDEVRGKLGLPQVILPSVASGLAIPPPPERSPGAY